MRIESIEPKLFAGTIADEFTAIIGEAIEERGVCTISFAGGSTPGQVYRSLSLPPRVSEIMWGKVKIFWGDERWVPQDDSHSNYRMVKETLLMQLRHEQPKIFPVNTAAASLDDAVREYEEVIAREVLPQQPHGLPCFDLMILGLGEDGHTASLFPGSPLAIADKGLCGWAPHPTDGTKRITMLPELIKSSREIVFICKGPGKADIVKSVLEGSDTVEKYPSRLFAECQDRVTWLLDSEAASRITQKRSA